MFYITSCRSLLHPIAVCDILCTSKRVPQDTIRRVSQDTIISVNYIMMMPGRLLLSAVPVLTAISHSSQHECPAIEAGITQVNQVIQAKMDALLL